MSRHDNSCVPLIRHNVAKDFSGPCQKILGGHKTIGIPQYNLNVTNPTPAPDNLLRDDATIAITDDFANTLANV